MARLSFLLPFFLVASAANDFFVNGLTMPLQGVRRASAAAAQGVVKRAGVVDLQNSGDLQYYMNVTLGGRLYRVLVDSGSADLWVAGAVPDSTTTNHSVSIQYHDGTAAGTVQTATLGIEGATISNQVYVQQAVDALHPDGQGVLGIGPSALSSTSSAIPAPDGNTVMDNLIALQGSSYVTTLISRPTEGSDIISAQLTVGEVISDHADVQTAAQLGVSTYGWNQHWLVSLDDGGIIGPDNKTVKASEGTRLRVVFDSGYTMSQIPSAITEAIYSRVPGAQLTTIDASPSPVWTMPCNVELNVTFQFGGVSYPIHPLDTVMNDISGPSDDSGTASCVGAFQPMNSSQPYDILLGMAFLRNAYILMNLSDQPYIQLLSLTDPANAHQDFVQQRLGGVDTTGSQQLLPDIAGLSDNPKPVAAAEKYKVFIIAGSIIGAFIVISVVGILIVWYRKRRYHKLHAPAPEGVLSSRAPKPSPSWKEFKDSEPKSGLKTLSLGFTSRPRSKALPKTPPSLSSTQSDYSDAVARKQSAGDLAPNRRSYKAQSLLPTARSQTSDLSRESSTGEGAALLGNVTAPGAASLRSTPSVRSSEYSTDDGPILIIGEKPLPKPLELEDRHTSDERDIASPREVDEEDPELPLMTPADPIRASTLYGNMPQTPASARAPARADSPDPYDLPPLPPLPVPAQTPEPARPKKTATSRPLPTPKATAGDPARAHATPNAFESLSRGARPGHPKPQALPAIDTSSAALGKAAKSKSKSSGSKSSKPRRTDNTPSRS